MSTEERNGPKTYPAILNNIRREAAKIREANDKLRELCNQLTLSDRPAPAQVLYEAATTIGVALVHIRDVFREF